jgi:hypothetical protein
MDESLTSRNFQPASPPVAGHASRFPAGLAAGAGPALTRFIGAWLREPDSGADSAWASAWDVAVLRAGVLATWPPDAARAPAPSREPGPGKVRPAGKYAGRQPSPLASAGRGRWCR